MPDESLLTDEVRALVGREQVLGMVQVTPRAVRRAVEVYTGRIPKSLPADGEDVPGYAIAAFEGDFEPEPLPSLMPNSLLIANEWSFERPLRMGETLTAVHVVASITERFGGRFGYSIDTRTETLYKDLDGGVVARSGFTMTQYSAAEAREGGGGL
ncbi:MAG TPA: hypothetical protein PJ994_06580 [Tepidiformaceae bacterium]|nr:hypothetical protein [Tepidiformaceae bacterium]HMO96609.1 hypothetical protein [Tepidiformaceae bacterium]